MHDQRLWAYLKLWCMCAAVYLSATGMVFAQGGQPRNQFGAGQRNRPTVSPYLNLVDNGNGTNNGDLGMNYYNLVRPIERGRQANRELKKELTEVESETQNGRVQGLAPRELAAITTGRMLPTGHTTSFASTGSYFGNQGGGRRGVSTAGNGFGRNGKN